MEIKEIQKSVFSVRLVKEEEVIQSFTQWASDQKIGFASFQAIGALKEVELGYYDLHKKTFLKKIFKDDLELLSGLGNISWVESKTPFVHFHASLGQRDYAVIGGQSMELRKLSNFLTLAAAAFIFCGIGAAAFFMKQTV